MFMVCAIMNGFGIRLSLWCFDQKGWLYAYIGKTTYGLYIYIYIYIYIEQIQFLSLFSGNLFPYLSQVMLWIDLPTGTPF
jgi:hypothetical protein